MPSANTIVTPVGLLPSQGLGNATTETIFLAGTINKLLPNQNLILELNRGSQLQNRHLCIKIVGRVLPGTTGTFDLRLYMSSFASANLLCDSGGVSFSSNGNFLLLCDAVWDKSSNTFNGVYYGQVGNTALGIAQLSNTPSSSTTVDSSSSAAKFETLLLTGQFGSSNAANNAFVDQFEVEGL